MASDEQPITRTEIIAINRTLNAALMLIAQAMTDVLILEHKLKRKHDFNKRVNDDTE